jgi:Cd2+/Zn2+-exporting ATPase
MSTHPAMTDRPQAAAPSVPPASATAAGAGLTHRAAPEDEGATGLGWVFTPRGELTGSLIAGTLLLGGFLASRLGESQGTLANAGHGLVWISLGIGLVFGGRAAWGALAEKKFDIDVLMVVGAVLAAALDAPAEGSLLLFLFTLSGALEDLAMQRTTRAVEALGKLMPTSAQRLQDGVWTPVEPEALLRGDRVRILPGELVPADARLTAGRSAMNQAALTGESMPREVGPGDELFAGTINAGDPIEAEVLRPAAQSSLQRIVNLVTQAQQQREPVQRLIDRLSQPYALSVMGVSTLVFIVWYLALGVAFKEALYTAITLLIVASPCALIISTPTATLAGISRGARGGVLFKGGQSIERLARLRAVAFDKTGTLTIGKPRVVRVSAVGWSDADRLLAVAAGLEEHSTHPIAEAILELAKQRGVAPAGVSEVRNVPGRGVSGLHEGREIRLGSLTHTQELIPVCLRARVKELLDQVQHQGQIAIVCAHDQSAAVFMLTDAVRPGAECLVERMHAVGVRPVVMLTGDNEATARRVAQGLGLDRFHAQLLPQDKVDHVQQLKAERAKAGSVSGGVGVIGDGVNDAPALAAADVAIAIGSIGSDAALESADIVLLADDLAVVPWAVALARKTRRKIITNLVFSLSAIGVMAVAVLLGHSLGYQLPLWMGVLGHEGGTLLVVANSLLLLAYPGVPVCTCDRSRTDTAAGIVVEPSGATATAPPQHSA